MEVAMIRTNIDEDREAIMARFLAGLDPNIAGIVELQHYVEIKDMVHMAMKMERQLKKKGTTRAYGGSSTKWGQGTYKPKSFFTPNERGGPSKNAKHIAETSKGKSTTVPVRSRDVQCFKCLGRGHIASQCPNRNTMFICDDREIEIDNEEEKDDEKEFKKEEELEHAIDGEVLVVKRSLSMQEIEGDQQHENIFHTRCHINGKEYEDLFPEEIPSGLPPIHGIEHQIDFVPGAIIPNRPAYRSNPEETKELQRQVLDLMEKGYVRESLSPCVVSVLQVPKKDGTWCIISTRNDQPRQIEEHMKSIKHMESVTDQSSHELY
ncbi:hypothetical protein V6N13_026599 [Hibiscus sabdariffa]